jgi:hypothetical protein
MCECGGQKTLARILENIIREYKLSLPSEQATEEQHG